MNSLLIILAILALWTLFEDYSKRPLGLMLLARVLMLTGRPRRLLCSGRIAWFHVNFPPFFYAKAMALGDVVLVSRKYPEQAIINDLGLMQHESIHIRQQKDMGSLWFLVRYISEWLFYLIKYRKPLKAYYSISLEREAFRVQYGSDWKVPE